MTAGLRTFAAQGLSMFPALLPGDRLCLEPLAERPGLSSGDLVCFLSESGRATIHRLQGRDALTGACLLAGDLGDHPDLPVAGTALLGRVVSVHRPLLGAGLPVPRLLWGRRWLPAWLAEPCLRLALAAHRWLPGRE
jgi:hypothetical protein